MYGILQPLVVTRKEVYKEDGGLAVEYELISGERRLRASKLAGLLQVPALIRNGEEDAQVKLELAIIENLQREDLNPVDRARAFERLSNEFKFKHHQIAEKVGKSREYVTNTLRVLTLPTEILNALGEGKISEGHTRPLLMLLDRPEEQMTLFKEIMVKKMTVREAEVIARKIAYDKIRKKERTFDPEIVELEEKLTQSLGTRVHIERKDTGGKVMIDFFSNEDLRTILDIINSSNPRNPQEMLEKHMAKVQGQAAVEGVQTTAVTNTVTPASTPVSTTPVQAENAAQSAPLEEGSPAAVIASAFQTPTDEQPLDDRTKQEKIEEDNSEELYSVKNFVV